MSVFLAKAGHRLNGRAAPKFLSDLAVHAALFPGAEDPHRFWRIMADIAFVHIDPLDIVAGDHNRAEK